MKEIQWLTVKKLLTTIELERAKMEFGNKYVFGYDDASRIILAELASLVSRKS